LRGRYVGGDDDGALGVRAWQAQVGRDAAAAAGERAVGEEADAWKSAQVRAIDASKTRVDGEIDSAETRAKDEIGETHAQDLRDIAADAVAAKSTAFEDTWAETREIDANETEAKKSADADYQKSQDEQPAAIAALKAKFTADANEARDKAEEGRKAARSFAAEDEKLAVARAKEVLANNKKQAADRLAEAQNFPASQFAWGNNPTVATAWAWVTGPGLDMATNFMTVWADGLTGGWWTRVYGQTGMLNYVNRNSLEYSGGDGAWVCDPDVDRGGSGGAATGMLNVARVYTTGMTVLGMATAANNIRNGGGSVWDYLAFAPGVGYVAGRAGRAAGLLNGACFVGETRVAVGWDPGALVVTTVEVDALAGGEEWSAEWIVAGSVLLGVALAGGNQRGQGHLAVGVLHVAGGGDEDAADGAGGGVAGVVVEGSRGGELVGDDSGTGDRPEDRGVAEGGDKEAGRLPEGVGRLSARQGVAHADGLVGDDDGAGGGRDAGGARGPERAEEGVLEGARDGGQGVQQHGGRGRGRADEDDRNGVGEVLHCGTRLVTGK
jgi:hypothetical protein